MYTKIAFTLSCLMLTISTLQAQERSGFDSMMLSNGKIYTVVGVLLIIFIGIIIYLFNTDRKLKSIENQIKSNE